MKFSFTIILLTALVPFTFGSNDTLVAYNRSNSENILAYAHIGEEDTNQLFDELADKDATPIFLDNNYSSYYFKNLYTNFGNNKYGTCSYVSLGMLLSFYDSYWDDVEVNDNMSFLVG